MLIHGINKLTLLDFPEHTACTLFTGGCNFRCPFCQNGSLVLSPQTEPVIDEGWLFEFLKKRRNVLQGVCITGGEPTIQGDLAAFICKIRELGYKIKLDTNGYRPEVLEQLLEDGLLDAVAMDIKSSPESYARVCGLWECDKQTDKTGAEWRMCSRPYLEGCSGHVDETGTSTEDDYGRKHAPESTDTSFRFENIERSVALITEYGRLHPDFYYEFRTTLVRGLHTADDMRSIGRWLAGTTHYFLQHYEDSGYVIHNISEVSSKHGLNVDAENGDMETAVSSESSGGCMVWKADGSTAMDVLTAFSAEEMQEMADIVRIEIPSVQIRGI